MSLENIKIYICSQCGEAHPSVSNSAPSKDGDLCVPCIYDNMFNKFEKITYIYNKCEGAECPCNCDDNCTLNRKYIKIIKQDNKTVEYIKIS